MQYQAMLPNTRIRLKRKAYIILLLMTSLLILRNIVVVHTNTYEGDTKDFPGLLKIGSTSQSHGINHMKNDMKTTCISIAMLSRSTEFDLRDWQRKEFHRQVHFRTKRSTSESANEKYVYTNFYTNNNVIIRQYFMIGINKEDSIMEKVKEEQKLYEDVQLLRLNEGYSHLTAHTWDSFHLLLPELESQECDKSYLVRADNDFVLHYETLTQTVLSLNSTSTIFGRMIPNMPTETARRYSGGSAHNFLPIWAHGGLYGLSADVVRYLTSNSVERTILKKQEGYFYPEEDRAIGLALSRSSIYINQSNNHDGENTGHSGIAPPVENIIFTKKAFHVCALTQRFCDDYGDFMGFSIGFGISGDKGLNKKIGELSKVSKSRTICDRKRTNKGSYKFEPSEHFFRVDEKFLDTNPMDALSSGCGIAGNRALKITYLFYSGITKELKQLENQHGSEKGKIEKIKCAEYAYRQAFPQVNRYIEDGKYQSGRDHFLDNVLTDSSLHYYCPRMCEQDPECKGRITQREILLKKVHERFHLETTLKDAFGGCLQSVSTFIDITTPYVQNNQWPVSGAVSNEPLHPETCKAVVYIDGRDHPWMDYALRIHRRYTGPEWMLYLIGPPQVTEKWRLRYSGETMVTIVDLPTEYGDLSDYPKQINNLFKSKFLWRDTVKCEHVLVTQADALMLRHGIDEFLKYDFVGAPIYPESHPSLEWRWLASKNPHKYGGNGGFSLRRRSFVLKALDECSIPKEGGHFDWEDSWYSACAMELGAYLPSNLMANRFSVGSTCESDLAVGMHKLWQNCEELTCNEAILSSSLYNDIYHPFEIVEQGPCPEGEMYYRLINPAADEVIREGISNSAHEHFERYGTEDQYNEYRCFSPKTITKKSAINPFEVDDKYFKVDSSILRNFRNILNN